MSCVTRTRGLLLAVFAAALLTFSPREEVALRADEFNGLPTESELTAKWWEWAYSIPVSENPLFDETGDDAFNGQPYKKVMFLAGVINVSGMAERSITVPEGTAFFFPILNVENDNGGVPKANQLSLKQLRALTTSEADSAADLFLNVDGEPMDDLIDRVASPPFAYHLPATDNIAQFFGINISGTVGPAVSDGYWV
jgi:hypothetical protein